MKTNNPEKRSAKVAAAFGAILLTAGCASSYDPLFAGLPKNLDGGVGQLLRYCSKFQNSGDLVTAAGLCDRAHQLDPADPDPLMQLADILQAMGRPDQAMATYQTIITALPDHIDARYALGKLYIAQGEYDTAVAQFQVALQYQADDPRLYNALGVSYGLIGANHSALQAFEDGLDVAPMHTSLRNNMGLSLVLNGRHEEGIEMLEALAADPAAEATSHKNLQLAYGMITAAKADLAASEAEQMSAITAPEYMASPEPAPVESVQRAPAKMAAAPSPVSLIPEAETEFAFNTTGESVAPLEVAVMDEPIAAANSSTPAARSPLRMQTAKADSGEIEDSDAPSAFMGDYLTAEASFPQTPTASPAPETEVAALQPMTSSTATPARSGNYTVQLASYRSEGRAMRGWTELRDSAPDLLEALTPMVRRADLGGEIGTVYRLRTATTAKDEATALCDSLKARGIDCLVIKEAPSMSEAQSG